MAYFINLVFFIFFGLFVIVCVMGWFLYRSVRDAAERLRGGNRRADNDSQRYGSRRNATDDEVIIDRRTPGKVNRKIYSEGEGEYVDFEEEK